LFQHCTYFIDVENCSEIWLDSTGPSANAHDGWYKENLFGYYQFQSVDLKRNWHFKKANSDYVIYKSYDIDEHWQVHDDRNSSLSWIRSGACNDSTTPISCSGSWEYYEDEWKKDGQIFVKCRYG